MPVHPLIQISIYGSLACYVVAAGLWLSKLQGKAYRNLWSAGCLLMWAHAFAAFHFYHGWSHQHAVDLTAMETQRVMGVAYGRGIWASYGLLLLWAADVLLCWLMPTSKERSASWQRWFTMLVHAYAFFILFNGTVIFEEGIIRWAGIVGTIWLARMAWRFRATRVQDV